MSDDQLPLELSVTELARLKGVRKQAIAKRLARLEAAGLIRTRQAGKAKMVPLAQWDEATSEHSDLARLAGAVTARLAADAREPAADPSAERNPSYTHELTRKARYDADRREIELKRLRGALVETRDVENAAVAVAERLVRAIDMLPAMADDLAGAVSRGGVAALRDSLKVATRTLRTTLTESMTEMATAAASACDEPPEESNDDDGSR